MVGSRQRVFLLLRAVSGALSVMLRRILVVASRLLRDRNFMALWAGQSVSEIGSAITVLALPLLAITSLHAGTLQVGILQACSTASFLLVSIPAGVLVDRS